MISLAEHWSGREEAEGAPWWRSGLDVAASQLGEAPVSDTGFRLYGDWLAEARSEMDWTAPHFRLMQDALDRVTIGELRRVIFQVGIRHGKTENNTLGYAAYRLEQEPTTRILVATYSQPQARKLSRGIKKIVRSRGLKLSGEVNSADEWETTAGGGVKAVGAGSGVASVNADLIIIDDPIGKRADAESPAHREMVWDWLTSDILARCEPHTQVLFSMPRWHQDDPIGRMRDRQADRWYVIDLPGVAEAPGDGPPDPLGRVEGELLWPALRGQEWMDEMRVDLGSYGFASLMQGRPRPREGGMFKWDWWQLVDQVPKSGPMVRYWDLAGTDATGDNDPDYSAGALLCRMPDERTCVVNVERFRLSVAKRDARLEQACRADLKAYGGRVVWWIEAEAGIQGKERTEALVRRLQNLGMTVRTEHPTGSKVMRAEPLASKAEAGNVVLCTATGDWVDPFRLEAADFTGRGDSHDDQIDATAGADAKLSKPRQAIRQGTVAA